MYSQSKGRHFNVGQHEELLSYLLSICPLHPGEDWEEDKKLNLILSKVQEHQQSLRDPGSGGKSISLILNYIGTHFLYVHMFSVHSAEININERLSTLFLGRLTTFIEIGSH